MAKIPKIIHKKIVHDTNHLELKQIPKKDISSTISRAEPLVPDLDYDETTFNFNKSDLDTISDDERDVIVHLDETVDSDELDQTWIAFVEFCQFVKEHVREIQIGETSLAHNEGSPMKNIPSNVKLILKKDYPNNASDHVSYLVKILKKMVLRELLVGLTRNKTCGPHEKNPSPDSKDLAPTIVITI